LLFQWRRIHEAAVLDRLGKPGDRLREKVRSQHIEEFADTSYLAQQIILDKPLHWEYKLTAEILRAEFGPVAIRWDQLKRGMYVSRSSLISSDQVLDWLKAKMNDNLKMVNAMHPLLDDLKQAWGDPGFPGNEKHIVAVSRLIGGVAARLLEWEEEIRFSHVPTKYAELADMFKGMGGKHLAEIFRIPAEIAKVFDEENPLSYHHVNLVFTVPPNFMSDFTAAWQRATA
jgi:hypothetical protein